MEKETQISALVSAATKELLERHLRATGVKKGHLVEQALRHHLQALQELPADVIGHPKLVVTRKSGEAILKEIEGEADQGLARPAPRWRLGRVAKATTGRSFALDDPDLDRFFQKFAGSEPVQALPGRHVCRGRGHAYPRIHHGRARPRRDRRSAHRCAEETAAIPTARAPARPSRRR